MKIDRLNIESIPSILENGEHYFYTEDQLMFYKNWLDKVMQKLYNN